MPTLSLSTDRSFSGRQVPALDCGLAPKDKNVLSATPHYINVDFPDCEALEQYISQFETLDERNRAAPHGEVFVFA